MQKLTLIILSLLLISGCRYANDAADTTFKETKASTLLERYNRFKDISAVLDKKQADLRIWDSKLKNLRDEYKGVPRSQWSREDREYYNLLQSEHGGIAASYNELAAQYNADMAKINYAYTNIGDLPQGAEKPLPREYKPYETGANK